MRLFTRRETPPDEVVALLPTDDRVVAWADTPDGGVVLATQRGLLWPDGDGPRLIGWQFIDKVVWRDGTLTVTEADLVDDALLVDRTPVQIELSKARDLPHAVRKRVEANVVRSELAAVAGGAARFVARRVPGQDGVVWWARLEPGTADGVDVRAAITARLAILRAEWAEARRWD